MHFLILGANGRTGQLATAVSLQRGHTVTAVVRRASTITYNEGLTIIEGSPLRVDDIEKAMASRLPDAVLVTLAASRTTDSPFSAPASPRFFIRDCIGNALTAMKTHGVQKLIVMSVFGIGSSWSQLAWPLKAMFKYTNMKFQTEDHQAVDVEIREVGEEWMALEWQLVRPVMLKDAEEAEPVRRFGEEGKGVGMFDSVSRISVAEFLVKAAEGGRGRTAVVIAN